MPVEIALIVNGQPVRGTVEPPVSRRLPARSLDLTGTHLGCEHGACGTMHRAGRQCRRALVPDVRGAGREARKSSPRGLARDGELSPLQRAFGEHHALQCGFCTPGFLVTATALLAENPDPTPDEVRAAISGNICRCTGYIGIVEAILAAAKEGRR
jgi:carbon-monoxide dehydrogenase small subunit